MKYTRLFSVLSILTVLGVALLAVTPAFAASATIDFEGLAEGTIVGSLSSGNGISGDPFGGDTIVVGVSPHLEGNQAMIFDATCSTGGCSGDDDDLFNASLGNVLIVSEDGDSTDPDDSDNAGQYLTFDFSGFGPGEVTVESLVVGDVEAEEPGGVIQLYADGLLVATIPLPTTGDGVYAIVNIGVSGVDFMVVDFAGSAAVDNIKISIEEPPPPPGDQGCTPGYWKNHLDSWSATGYSPSQTVEDVFDVPDGFGLDNDTLLTALDYPGGPGTLGGARILLHAAVAAVLNAAHPDVAYPLTTAEIIDAVNTALLGTRDDMIDLGADLDANNNLGCPLN
jgi:hypothetical protein